MINITEEFEKRLSKYTINKIMSNHGFDSFMSSDEYVLNYSKVETDFDNLEVQITVYIDDAPDDTQYSLSVSTPNIIDYAYLSDYMTTEEELNTWFDNDYDIVLLQMKDLYN